MNLLSILQAQHIPNSFNLDYQEFLYLFIVVGWCQTLPVPVPFSLKSFAQTHLLLLNSKFTVSDVLPSVFGSITYAKNRWYQEPTHH